MEALIAEYPEGLYSFFLDDKKKILEFTTESPGKSVIGNVYVGRVEQVKKNINSAFVRISEDEKVFLSLKDCGDIFFTKKVGKGETLVEGDELLVQIEKEAHKTKLAKGTPSIVLSGRYCVLTTDKKKIFVSTKIERQNTRKHYKGIFKSMVTEQYGYIIRTNATLASDREIKEEMKTLGARFTEMMEALAYKPIYSLLYQPLPAYLKRLRDLTGEEAMTVTTASHKVAEEVGKFGLDKGLDLHVTVPKDMDTEALINAYGIRDSLKKLMQKKVWLKSGATIVIEPTEAMTVIDVNTEKTLSRKKSEDTILKTNLEAADAIMHQVRARNISGIIIIDFIDMASEGHKALLMERVDGLCRQMPVKTILHGMTTLGLLEITRKKLEKPLWENPLIEQLLKE